MSERILCAAIWVDTGVADPPRRSYSYPKTGLVFAGWRHSDCFTTLTAWSSNLSDSYRKQIGAEQLAGRNQGFITSTGRYVDRIEGAVIAVAAGQCRPHITFLTSEDLY